MAADAREESLTRPKGGGGKLNRTETVTVRLDPKLNYLCELAARAQRRTKSSFIEWAVDKALDDVTVAGTGYGDSPDTIARLAGVLWDVDEPDRVVSLAENAPFLMTHEEQLVWKLIQSNGFFWKGRHDEDGNWDYTLRPGGCAIENVRDHWETLKAVAAGDKPSSELPAVKKQLPVIVKPPPNFDPDLDDDVPF